MTEKENNPGFLSIANISNNEITTAVIGFLVASLIPAVLLGFDSPAVNLIYKFGMVVFFYTISITSIFCLAAPLFILFRHFKIITWWSLIMAGFVIGIIMAIISHPHAPLHMFLDKALIWGPIGSVSAFVFWLIWRFRVPEYEP